jgi:hypothetical protein
LVLRNVFLDVFNLTRLDRLLLDLLDLDIASLSTFYLLLLELSAWNLYLLRNRVIAHVGFVCVIFFILSQKVLKVSIVLTFLGSFLYLGVVGA